MELGLEDYIRKNKSTRCPKCKFVVEKIEGGDSMEFVPAGLVRMGSLSLTSSRRECGAEFCYNCGKLYDSVDTADQSCGCSERDREDDASDENRSEGEDSDEDEEMGE